MNRTSAILAILIAIVTAVACDRSHDGKLDPSYESQLVDLVTYTGVDDDNHATFRLEGIDDEPHVDLFTTVAAPQRVAKNSRVLLYYAINHKATDNSYWNIDARSLVRIISDSIRVNRNPIDTYSMSPIKLKSAWRTGEYINLYGQVEHTGKNRLIYMMIDGETRGNDTVQAYLVHDLLNTPADSIFYWRDFYISVNVGVLKSPSDPCRTIRLHMNNIAAPHSTYQDFNIK